VTTAGVARWSAGYLWEPSGQLQPSLWGEVDAGAGFPDVIVDGVLVSDRCTSVAWSLGRTWWLADPEPATASIALQGRLEGTGLAGLVLGDRVEIRADPVGPLWTGWVDAITETTEPQDGELAYGLNIGASDAMSRILSVELYNSLALSAGDLSVRVAQLAGAAGVPTPIRVVVLPTTAALPQLAAVTLTGSSLSPLTLGGHLGDCEKASNAIVAVDRDGTFLVLPRARVVATPEVVTLDDDSDPNRLERALATPERVRNVFTIAGTTTTIATSVAKYGRRGYDVPSGIASTAPPYSPETLAALAEPAPFAVADIPIDARTARAVGLSPFDWCRVSTRPADEYYQALALGWSAAPDDWQLSVGLDRTQMSIAAPPIDPDPPNPIPPTTATVTDTFLCDRSAYVVLTTGGLQAGNGASVDLLVGLLGDGNKSRGLVRFGLTWRGKVVSVASAKLRLRGGQTTCSAYGGSPSFRVLRNTSGWSAGTYATRCSFASGNAVVWPGPSVTTDSEVTKAGPKAEGQLAEIDVTGMARDWAAGAANYGVQLRGASEGSSGNRAPLWSKQAGASGDRPTLVVTYTYEVP
jgi:hypothetical protein